MTTPIHPEFANAAMDAANKITRALIEHIGWLPLNTRYEIANETINSAVKWFIDNPGAGEPLFPDAIELIKALAEKEG